MIPLSEKQLCMIAQIVSEYTNDFTITQTDSGITVTAKGWNVRVKEVGPYRLIALFALGMVAAIVFEAFLRVRF